MAINRCAPSIFLTAYYSHSYIGFFLGGIALFYLWRVIEPRQRPVTTALCATVFSACYVVQIAIPSQGGLTGVLPVLIVGCALISSRSGSDITWRPLILLGDASYAIYLSHTVFMGVLWRFGIMQAAKDSAMVMLAVVGTSIVIGVSFHLLIEKPMGRKIKEVVSRRSARGGLNRPIAKPFSVRASPPVFPIPVRQSRCFGKSLPCY